MLVISLLQDVIRLGRLPGAEILAFHSGLFKIGDAGLASWRDAIQRAVALAAFPAALPYVALLVGEFA